MASRHPRRNYPSSHGASEFPCGFAALTGYKNSLAPCFVSLRIVDTLRRHEPYKAGFTWIRSTPVGFQFVIDWESYQSEFRAAAEAANYRRRFDIEYVERCLAYARPLHEKKLPIIYDPVHLARLVGYQPKYLYGAATQPVRYYRSYWIVKRAGGRRRISEPLPSLKEIQRWILDSILNQLPVHRFAKGFVPTRSIRDNARFHKKQSLVLTVDIEDFFGSIRFPRVLHVFRNAGYSRAVSVLLARLCLLNDQLPQGAPTSPALSNQVAARIDRRLAAFAKKTHIHYTRYADDLTFSGTFDAGALITFVRQVTKDSGLRLNDGKTRLMSRHERQETTGIVLNEKLQAPRETRRDLRKAMHYIDTFGANSHIDFVGIRKANYLNHLLGIATFILFVNPDDRDALQAERELRRLISQNETTS